MSDRPNILFFSIDTLRYDMVARQRERANLLQHGVEPMDVMPNLDEWVGRSAFFSAASSVSTYTTSSHASALTGLYPPRHGSRSFLKNQIFPEVRTLQEILLGEGYRTILLTDTLRFFSYTALQRGFTDVVTSDAELAALLGSHDDRPLFILAHVFDVHMPYLYTFDPASPDENKDFYSAFDDIERRFHLKPNRQDWGGDFFDLMRRYRQLFGQLAELDESRPLQLDLYRRGARKFDQGRFARLVGLLQKQRFFENALFAGFSDHGEGFYPHSPQLAHSGPLTEETSRILLFLWHSDGCAARDIEDPVSLIDLMPTALEFAGLGHLVTELPYTLDGVSLLQAMSGHAMARRLVHQEVWVDGKTNRTAPRGDTEEAEEVVRVAEKARAETTLHQRATIGRKLKLVVTGLVEEEYASRLAAATPPKAFAQTCYESILGRVGDEGGVAAMVANITAAADPEEARQNIISTLLASPELAVWGKFHLFDYRADPTGSRRIEFRPGGWRGRGHRAMLEELRRVSRFDTPPGPPINVATADEQAELGSMLEALGYADGEG